MSDGKGSVMSYEPGPGGRRLLFVCNPHSGGADDDVEAEIRRWLRRAGDVTTLEPSSHEAFAPELRDAAAEADVVVVGGGDGTFGDAVNALADRLAQVTLALVPMGTGNDLARTLGVPEDPVDAARALCDARRTELDIGRARGGGVERLFVNACVGGLPVAVDRAVAEPVKKALGPLAFWAAGAKGLLDARRFTATVNGAEVRGCLVTGVGNGRSAGGGFELWPRADPGDGILDHCAVAVPSMGAALQVWNAVRGGKLGSCEHARLGRAARVTIAAEPDIELNVDGDLVGLRTPATFEVAGRVGVLVPG